MPGNEVDVIRFLIKNHKIINLNYLKKISLIQIPYKNKLIDVTNEKNIQKFYSDDAYKKADIFLNGIGISIKQSGGNVAYNKIQRKTLFNFLKEFFSTEKTNNIIFKLDEKILDFHNGKIKRDVAIEKIMNKEEFKIILEYLMLKGSTTIKSSFPAKLILIAQKKINSFNDIQLLNFEYYFKKYMPNIVFALRRIWVGQSSDSEHSRAVGMSKEKMNQPWCFNKVSGKPNKNKYGFRWRKDFPEKKRKTIFYINIIHN